MTSLSHGAADWADIVIGMVMYMTKLMCLVLAEQICCYGAAAIEQVQNLATANTSTTCCCEHVRNTSAAHNVC